MVSMLFLTTNFNMGVKTMQSRFRGVLQSYNSFVKRNPFAIKV